MTQVLTWNHLQHLNVGDDAAAIQRNAAALFALMSCETLSTEIGILKSVLLKITIRLRSAKATMILNQIMKRIDKYRGVDVRTLISPATNMIFKSVKGFSTF